MNLAHFAVRHLKAIAFLTLALCLIGGWEATTFPVSILPDVTFPRLKILVDAGDRPARNVEIEAVRPLEEAVAAVPHLKRIEVRTQRGGAEMAVDFADGTDMLQAQNLVTAKIDQVRPTLPSDLNISAERMNPTLFPVVGISLYSRTLSQGELWQLANFTIRPRLARVNGVARVVIQGGRTPEVAVEVLPQRLAAYHLTLQDIDDALSKTNLTRGVGHFDQEEEQYETLITGQITDLNSLGEVVVAAPNGVPLHLRDVASIRLATGDRTTIVTANGRESVLLNIVRQPDANTVSVVSGVEDEVNLLRSQLPRGTEISTFYDQSLLINDAISSVRDAVLLGGVLAIFVLLLFLGDWRATAVTAAIIPATVLITFLLMRVAGLTLNLMTLGALAVGVGLVIDDAIVVVENVFRHLLHGEDRARAVRLAAGEIAAPMISSTLTTVVVFLPLTLLQGVAGAFFSALAITLTIALLVSLVLALLLSPSLCAAFLKARPGGHGEAAEEHGPLFERFVGLYERVLGFVLGRRWVLLLGAAAALGCTVFFAGNLQTGFMPEMDEGAFILDYLTPPGTSLNESDRILRQIEAILQKTPEVTGYSRRTGTELGFAETEPNSGDFAVMLKQGSRRRIDDVISDVRTQIQENVAGADVDFSQVLQDLIGDLSGSPAPIEIKLFSEDQDALTDTGTDLAAKLGTIKGFADIQSGVVAAGPELVAHVDNDEAARAGLSADAVASQAESAMLGDTPTTIMQGDRPIPVRVRFPAAYRNDQEAVAALPVESASGTMIPLGALVHFETVNGTTELDRENQRRMLSVTANLDNVDLGTAVGRVQKLMDGYQLPTGMTWELGGQYASQRSTFVNFEEVLALAIALVFAVMLFQFGSFTAPGTILLVMPLALFGVTLGLWLTGTQLNVSSLMGAIMLVGIVVKNGILLLDHAQKREQSGIPVEQAVLEAGRVRLRPILMTTLTAILGLFPLAMGWGAGAEMQKPLAIAVIGGLSFSTFFTLLFAPALYVTLRRAQIALFGGAPKASHGGSPVPTWREPDAPV